ncbi:MULTISPECIES: hypothetical protein [unclassified Streptomyces]|uniref:hypothetical protein n=1 Tax=unclassified Streptomyces TaxID=2593676 RepID=UPI0003A5A703|nr:MULTISPECIES: hypothetical protein [unclassified Streptomyces]MYQ76495.1 hypothetical protein [Streptomyces sp. SID4923]
MESVPVRCPACRRDHAYVTPVYPCPCGEPTAPPLLRGAPVVPITHRTWNDDWVTVRCRGCGRHDQWPQPELCCPCGAVLRVPVRPVTSAGAVRPAHIPLPRTAAAPRPAFRPLTIRTARDAVAAAALYLTWLGFEDVTHPVNRPASRIDLRASGLIAEVDSTTRPTALRDVECLWLNALNGSVRGVLFSLAGYTPEARKRADTLRMPLFVLDLTGTPQPVNGAADELVSTGA